MSESQIIAIIKHFFTRDQVFRLEQRLSVAKALLAEMK